MANSPSYYQTATPVTYLVQHQEHVFHIMARQGSANQRNIVRMTDNFGSTWAINWELMDGAMVIGRLQGMAIATNPNFYLSSNLVFTDQRFEGSTLNVQGRLGPAVLPNEGDWAVLGGTGEFTCAQGNVAYKRIYVQDNDPDGGCTMELHIRVVCLTFPKPNPVQKVGPWGGSGGTAYEIQDDDKLPKRLESIRIYADDNVVQSIAFSYIDQAGHNPTVGPWHRDDGISEHRVTIQLRASETVKILHGTTGNYGGHTVVTSLTIVTNRDMYGPYGKNSTGSDTPFHAVAPENHSIVGFYGRLGQVVDQIGAYVRHDDD